MNVPKSVNPNIAIGLPVAFFILWMQRHKRWHLMIGTMDGTYKIKSAK